MHVKDVADAFPDPRQEAEIGMEVILAASLSGTLCRSLSVSQEAVVAPIQDHDPEVCGQC